MVGAKIGRLGCEKGTKKCVEGFFSRLDFCCSCCVWGERKAWEGGELGGKELRLGKARR